MVGTSSATAKNEPDHVTSVLTNVEDRGSHRKTVRRSVDVLHQASDGGVSQVLLTPSKVSLPSAK